MPDKQATGDPAQPPDVALVELICQITRCQRVLQNLLNGFSSRWKLSGTELLILWLCARNAESGLSQRDLATAVGISPARMSGLVEGLRGRRLLSPWRCPSDRRRQHWKLERDGWKLLTSAQVELEHFVQEHSVEVPEAAQRHLASLVRHLTDLLESRAADDRTPAPRTGILACTEAEDDCVYRRAS